MTVAVVVKGYPRLSETFIARELLGLRERGVDFVIVSLRRPTDAKTHDLHDRIGGAVLYLPEYLHDEPRRVSRGLWRCLRLKGFLRALRVWLRDLVRDRTANRIRRFGQALVLAAEMPEEVRFLYIHYLHTPASVGRYAAILRGLDFAFSAHAKDVWTTPAWELREKLRDARWTVTCTRANLAHLARVAPGAEIGLVYHGVDTWRFSRRGPLEQHDGRNPRQPVRILCVARAVPKKGLDTLLHALAALFRDLAWRFDHAGGGALVPELAALAEALGLGERVRWHGGLSLHEIKELLEAADIFCLPARIAADGDRDGLPNALLEAMSMELPVVTTAVSAIPEIVEDGVNGVLVEPDRPDALARALAALARAPERRDLMGRAARRSVLARFSAEAGYDLLAERLGGRAVRTDAARCASPSTRR